MATDIHPDTEQTSARVGHRLPRGRGPRRARDRTPSDDRRRQEWMMVGIGAGRARRHPGHRRRVFAFATAAARATTTTVVNRTRPPRAAGGRRAGQGADAGRRQGRRVREVRQGRPDAARRPRRRGQEVHRRRPPARHPGRPRPRADRGVELRRQRQGLPRHRRQPADRRQPGRQGPDHLRQRRLEGDGRQHGRTRSTSTPPRSRPNKNYIDVAPGKKLTIDFVAKHPGVFMYHCATQPVLMHTSAGMMGMMVVKPRNLRAGRQGAVDDPGGVLPRRPRQAGRHGQDGGRDARRDRLQRLRQPVQGAPDHRAPRREDPHVRPRRRPEQVERLPRHRHGLRHAPYVEGVVGHDAQTVNLRADPGRLGRVHARPGGQLPVRHPRLRRHGQGRGGHPAHDRRAEGRRPRRRRRRPRRPRHGRR